MVKKLFAKVSKKINSKDADQNELVKNSALSFSVKMIGLVANYCFVFFTARFYGVRGSGIYSIFQTTYSFFINIGKFGLDTALIRFVSQFRTSGEPEKIANLYFKVLRFVIVSSLSIAVKTGKL